MPHHKSILETSNPFRAGRPRRFRPAAPEGREGALLFSAAPGCRVIEKPGADVEKR
jgi:hypothetical protein